MGEGAGGRVGWLELPRRTLPPPHGRFASGVVTDAPHVEVHPACPHQQGAGARGPPPWRAGESKVLVWHLPLPRALPRRRHMPARQPRSSSPIPHSGSPPGAHAAPLDDTHRPLPRASTPPRAPPRCRSPLQLSRSPLPPIGSAFRKARAGTAALSCSPSPRHKCRRRPLPPHRRHRQPRPLLAAPLGGPPVPFRPPRHPRCRPRGGALPLLASGAARSRPLARPAQLSVCTPRPTLQTPPLAADAVPVASRPAVLHPCQRPAVHAVRTIERETRWFSPRRGPAVRRRIQKSKNSHAEISTK